MASDPCTLSNCKDISLNHVSINWKANFTAKKLEGDVLLNFKVINPTNKVVLDTNKLKVESVSLMNGKAMKLLRFSFGKTHQFFGSPLEITLPTEKQSGDEFQIKIYYETGEGDDCTALQWLPVEQTKDKKHAFMFSQCQAIHARSLLPCFDSPGQKFSYEASVNVPGGCTALMSAIPKNVDVDQGKYSFEQPIPIPSYLLAICVGVLGRAEISPRCAVYSEPSLVKACAFEFDETEKFLSTAESFLGKYEWGRYDLLVLPPSFPYGGMENPCLTFVTPTLLAGDRSLVNVVAHEISHSWTGNLVTNASWDNFWLNEGFTHFCENKIVSKTKYPEDLEAQTRESGFLFLISNDVLKETVESFGAEHPFTCLKIDHSRDGGIDPDDAFSSIPYKKGAYFLSYLENLVGGAVVFEKFLGDYIATFKFKALTSDDFKTYFLDYFKESPELSQIDWEKWFNKPGMPVVDLTDKVDGSLYNEAKKVGRSWIEGNFIAAEEFALFSTEMKEVSLEAVKEFVSVDKQSVDCDALEEKYGFNSQNNAELLFLWFIIQIKCSHSKVIENGKMLEFLKTVGRMKFTRPLYKTLKDQGGAYEKLAIATFAENRSAYHSICQKMVARDLGLA